MLALRRHVLWSQHCAWVDGGTWEHKFGTLVSHKAHWVTLNQILISLIFRIYYLNLLLMQKGGKKASVKTIAEKMTASQETVGDSRYVPISHFSDGCFSFMSVTLLSQQTTSNCLLYFK